MAQSVCPIIVGGCHRSGTSLVRRILNAHSHIYCGPEIKFFRDFYSNYFFDPLQRERFFVSARAALPEEELFQILGPAFITLHERAASNAGKARWADKDPENVIYLREWERLLGDNWIFIHVLRNPLDTLASIKEAKFDATIPANLDARIAFYKKYTQAGLNWSAQHPGRYRQVIYEQLVSQPKVLLPQLMESLDESFEPGQLDFNQASHQRGLEDPKVSKTTEIHNQSLGRWQTTLTPAESAQIARELTPLWRQIDRDGKWATLTMPDNLLPELPAPSESQALAPVEARIGAKATSVVYLSQTSEVLARQKFEMEWQRAETEKWAKELLLQIEARDRELARIKSFLPIRLALALKRVLSR